MTGTLALDADSSIAAVGTPQTAKCSDADTVSAASACVSLVACFVVTVEGTHLLCCSGGVAATGSICGGPADLAAGCAMPAGS